jgi:hypothetical protein
MKIWILSFLAACSLHAKSINVGGYFTIDVPPKWIVTVAEAVTWPGNYKVYDAYNFAIESHKATASLAIYVINPPADTGMTLAEYGQVSQSDLIHSTLKIQEVGWSLLSVSKVTLNGIPAISRVESTPWSALHIPLSFGPLTGNLLFE